MKSPVPAYRSATFQPKRPNRRTSATSLIIGEAIRKENVTPRGTPVVTNPMNSGTAEQEQKGVMTPSNAASILPYDSRLPARMRLVRSGLKKERVMPTKKTTMSKSSSTFGVS